MKSWMASFQLRINGAVMSGRYLPEVPWVPSKQFEASRLVQIQRSSGEPCTLGSVISFNESYMDLTDWSYQKVGPVEIVWITCAFAFPLVVIGDVVDLIYYPPGRINFIPSILTTIFTFILSLPLSLVLGRILFYTFTGHTHYPVRLDRKNQMVHVFRHNGEGGVSSYRWRDVTFGMRGGGVRQYGFLRGVIAGCVKLSDGTYDYFRLGVMWPTEEGMRGQWEYFRRYMEEGPDSLPEPEILLPIDGRRESFRMGAQLCWFLAGPMLGPAIFLAPLTVPGSLLRWFLMHVTRTLPRWPQHIVDACPVSPDDRYASRPVKSLNVSLELAFVVTTGVLAFDATLLYWFIEWLSQPGYH
jgi:hypothetical protein